MMRFFGNTNIDFIGKRKIAFVISGIVILLGIIFMIISGLKYGIDFTGGVTLEVDLTPVEMRSTAVADSAVSDIVAADTSSTPAAADTNAVVSGNQLSVEDIRAALLEEGMDDVEIQSYKNNPNIFLIKTQIIDTTNVQTGSTKGDTILEILKQKFPGNFSAGNVIREKFEVGPRIGEELRGQALLAIFWALLGIIIYIWWRFEFTFGLAAIAALVHDILITLGIFAIFGKEISLPIIAALLTIVGYSLNDTIVVFDRIREDIKKYKRLSYAEIINHSINETLNRTIITSLTTFLVVLCLYIFGGTVIHDFAFALLIGVVVGTYSSIFIASPIMVGYFSRKGKAAKKRR